MKHPLRVYVAGPLRGPTPYHTRSNVEAARRTAEMLWRMGYAVFCPHLNTEGMIGMLDATDDLTDDFFIDADLQWLTAAHLAVFSPDWEDSVGATREHHWATFLDVPIFYCHGATLQDATGRTLPAKAITLEELKPYTRQGEKT